MVPSCVNHLRFHAPWSYVNSGAKQRSIYRVCLDRSSRYLAVVLFRHHLYTCTAYMVMSLFRSSQSGVSQEPGGALIRVFICMKRDEWWRREGTTNPRLLYIETTHIHTAHNSVTHTSKLCVAIAHVLSLSIFIYSTCRRTAQHSVGDGALPTHFTLFSYLCRLWCTAAKYKKNIYWTLLRWIRLNPPSSRQLFWMHE